MTESGIGFDEVRLSLLTPAFSGEIARYSPAGRVPVLVDRHADGTETRVWDTLAIAEYLAEKFPDATLWPRDTKARARARSVCAEMHSGFGALRTHCPLNVEASLPQVGALAMRDQAGLRSDLERIVAMWTGLLDEHKGPMLFGDFSVADAFFAPVCLRIRTYWLPVPNHITAYMQRVSALPGVKAWIDAALAEHDFLDFEEPYRLSR
jgi:glutathione S-transferase